MKNEKSKDKKMKNKKITESFNNAINGILYTLKNERNMKIHLVASVVVLIACLFFRLSKIEILIVCLTIAGVIICELFNTAIEAVVDIIVDVYHPKAKIVKDVAAGAVLVSASVSVLVAYFIFFDKISSRLEKGIGWIKQTPINITVVAIIITMIIVMVIKTFLKKGTPFRGGLPSGHSAVSFAITTSVALWTNNMIITLLCLILSLLVVQSRWDAKIHSVVELSAGALLGSLVTLLLYQLFYR